MSRTFGFVDYRQEQGGKIITGNIVTNDRRPIVETKDIISWVFTIDNMTFTSLDPGASTEIVGELASSESSLTAVAPTGDVTHSLEICGGGYKVTWQKRVDGSVYSAADDSGDLWNYTGEVLGRSRDWIIAQV
jgi:hypothetical protein